MHFWSDVSLERKQLAFHFCFFFWEATYWRIFWLLMVIFKALQYGLSKCCRLFHSASSPNSQLTERAFPPICSSRHLPDWGADTCWNGVIGFKFPIAPTCLAWLYVRQGSTTQRCSPVGNDSFTQCVFPLHYAVFLDHHYCPRPLLHSKQSTLWIFPVQSVANSSNVLSSRVSKWK